MLNVSSTLLRVFHNLTSNIQRVYTLYRPYFGWSGDNLPRTLAFSVLIVCNIANAITMVFIQNSFASLSSIIVDSAITYGAFYSGVLGCLAPVCIFASLFTISWSISSWLEANLTMNLQKYYVAKLINDKAYYGIKFIADEQDKKEVNSSSVIKDNLKEITVGAALLLNDFTRTFLSFLVGAYQLWLLSSPLVLSIASITIAIPGYMLLGAFVYAVSYSLLISLLDSGLTKLKTQLKNQDGKISADLHHLDEHAEAIAFKKGEAKERDRLHKNINKSYLTQFSIRWREAVINFFQNVSNNLVYMFGLILSAPAIFAKTIDPNLTFAIANYFSSIVSFFSWKKENTQQLTGLYASLERFETFKQLLQQWDILQNQIHLEIIKANAIGVKDLKVLTPNGDTIFNNISFELPLGKITVIQGPSGIGKSTIFRSLAGLWPYVVGKYLFPVDNKQELTIYNIPQKPYFPLRCTLLEAICYPNLPTQENRTEIIGLMKDLGFRAEIINHLEEKQNNWGEYLSPGEQQRVAIIGAIIQKPDILFMDEGTNGIDPNNRQTSERIIKEKLPNTTIVAIDHHAALPKNFKPFYDYRLVIKPLNQQGAEIEENKPNVSIKLKEYKTP